MQEDKLSCKKQKCVQKPTAKEIKLSFKEKSEKDAKKNKKQGFFFFRLLRKCTCAKKKSLRLGSMVLFRQSHDDLEQSVRARLRAVIVGAL